MSRLGSWPAALAVIVVAGGGVHAADEPTAVASRVEQWLAGANALVGGFEQTLVSGALGGDVVEHGRLWIRRPGAMRWDYEEPEPKVAVVRDGQTLLYLPSEGQVLVGELDEDGSLLAVLLAGGRPLSALFDAEALHEDDPGPPDGVDGVRMRPKDAEGSFESVSLYVARDSGAILRARVRDGAGNVMDYRFPGLERVDSVPDSVFAFEPPPGTERLSGG